MEDKIQLAVGKSAGKDVLVDAQELVTGRTCVIGQSGSGKSYLIGVICEKLLENNIAFCIVDTEGEYFSLKQKFQVLWAGGKGSDVEIENVDISELITKSIQDNIPLVLDVSDAMDERKVIANFASKLYEVGSEARQPYLLIIEEADKFVPQSKDSIKEIEEISKRGRKRGIGLLVATQRPSLVNKNVLSQCGNRFIGKLATENDLKAVDLFFSDRKELESLPKLNQGEFFVSGSLTKEKLKMKSAERVTQHKGLTPKLIPKATGKITELMTVLGSQTASDPGSEKKEVYKTKTGSIQAIKLEITKETLDQIIDNKKKKKYGLFGKKENLTSADLIYHPLLWVEISVREGLIRKGFKKYSFIADAIAGNFVEIKNGLKYYKGISKFTGLDENQIKVLLEIGKSKKITTTDLELKTKLSDITIRKITASLQDKKLLTFSTEGRSKLYSPLTDIKIPDLKQSEKMPQTETTSGKQNNAQITEESIRKIIKAALGDADITKSELFYYPVWQINFDGRKIIVDGVTGKDVSRENF